jgi:hypothetical protein
MDLMQKGALDQQEVRHMVLNESFRSGKACLSSLIKRCPFSLTPSISIVI